MTCLEARKNIFDYLNSSLDDHTLREFLRHIDSCPDCMEELRVTEMVYSGVRKLDEEDFQNMDFEREFRRLLEESRFHLRMVTGRHILASVVDTLAFWSLVTALVLKYHTVLLSLI